MRSLGTNEVRWLAEQIDALLRARANHPHWSCRLDDALDVLVWSASVDGVDPATGKIEKDGWIPAGQRLRREHFRRAPHTKLAWQALVAGQSDKIKREHVVPRKHLRRIITQAPNVDVITWMLSAYALVALVHEDDRARRS